MRQISYFSLIIAFAVIVYPLPSRAQFHFSGIVQHVKSVVFNTNFYQKVNSRETSANGRSDVEINFPENAMGLPTNKTPLGVTNLPTEDNGNGNSRNASFENRPIETSSIGIVEENSNPWEGGNDNDDNDARLTDEEEELLHVGFPLDYSFTETRQDWQENLISAPGCPASGEMIDAISHPRNRHAWVHYGNPPRCYLIGTQGPCPLEMKLAAQRNSTFGVCKCDCYFNHGETKFDVGIDPYGWSYLDNWSSYCDNGEEIFLFFKKTCYGLLSRGPCAPGFVLLWDSLTREPDCLFINCHEQKLNDLQRNKESFRFLANQVCKKPGNHCILDSKYSELQSGVYSIDINSTYQSCKIEDTRRGFSTYVEPTPMRCDNLKQKFSRTLKTCIPVSRYQLLRVG